MPPPATLPLLPTLLVSLVGPGGIGALMLFRYQRNKLRADTRAQESTADETDAKAEVLLAGEALQLFKEARADAKDARDEARGARAEAAEARAETALLRRTVVELWAANDATDRHMRRLEHAIEDLGGTVPPRPPGLTPRLPNSD